MSDLQIQARALGDPTRHGLFRHLAASSVPLGVTELAEVFGLHHNAIRQHLAKLSAAGLVTAEVVPAGGRGRPRSVYRVAAGVESRWGPSGPYERLSRWLLDVIGSGATPRETGRRIGRERAASAPAGATAAEVLVAEMAREGFAPTARRRGRRVDVVLHACPFAEAALAAPEVVCALHRGLAEGLLERVEAGPALVVEDLVVADPRRAPCRLRCREAA